MDTLVLLPAADSSGLTESPRWQTVHLAGDSTADNLDGLNANPATYQAIRDLSPAAASDLVDWLRAHLGKTFYWTVTRETAARQWQATSWRREFSGPERDRVTVTLEERFVP